MQFSRSLQQVQAPNSTTVSPVPTRQWHRPHGWRIAGAVIWIIAIVYGLVLATRFVRAVERIADNDRSRM